MSEPVPSTSLARRVLREHRGIVVPLVAALIMNILAYAFFVYPLSRRVANVTQRTEAAEAALAAARLEHARASGTLTGKDQAAQELATFYTTVLPGDMAGARRLTHLRLAQLARAADLYLGRAATDIVTERDVTLTEFRIQMELVGTYEDMRTFVHAIETAPEFVVLKNVALAEESGEDGELRVSVELATYYRGAQ